MVRTIRISNVNILTRKNIYVALSGIYGIGKKFKKKSRARQILEKLNINPFLKAKDLTDEQINLINHEIQQFEVEGDLKQIKKQNIEEKIRINCLQVSSRTATGYRGTKKSTPFAAQKAAEAALEKLTEFGISLVEIIVWGIGSGRDAVIKKICNTAGLQVEKLVDKTALAFNGCRPRKTPPIFAVKISDKAKTITNEIAKLEGVKEIPIYLNFHLKKLVFQSPSEDYLRQGKICTLQINVDNSQGKEEYVVTGKDIQGELTVLNPETYLATVAPAAQLKITLYCSYHYVSRSAKEQKSFFSLENKKKDESDASNGEDDNKQEIQLQNEENLIFLDSDYCPVKTQEESLKLTITTNGSISANNCLLTVINFLEQSMLNIRQLIASEPRQEKAKPVGKSN
ncbi:14213_t:CDS:2 [Entrophospora sp. SA101]|nr:14213_t:CDS:2 [Entrophospora sp. SA101]